MTTRTALIATVVCTATFASHDCHAQAREWSVNGKAIDAHLVAFDGTAISLRTTTGKALSVAVDDLSADDSAFLKMLVDFKASVASAENQAVSSGVASGSAYLERLRAANTSRSLALQEQALQIQAAQYWSQWYDLWVVQFGSPRGPFWVLVPARDSYEAERAASARNQHASVLWVVRLNRK